MLKSCGTCKLFENSTGGVYNHFCGRSGKWKKAVESRKPTKGSPVAKQNVDKSWLGVVTNHSFKQPYRPKQ